MSKNCELTLWVIYHFMKETRSRKWFATIWNKQDYEKIKQLTYQYLIISADDRT